MQFTTLALSALFAAAAVASPIEDRNYKCLSDWQANYFVQAFHTILGSTNRTLAQEVAGEIVVEGYIETSDSINSLAGIPLGQPSDTSKEAFVAGLAFQPPIPEITDLLIIHDCEYVVWYWVFSNAGAGDLEVKGINIFTTSADRKQLVADNLEFNSIAWGIDDNQTTNTPPPPPPGAPGKMRRSVVLEERDEEYDC